MKEKKNTSLWVIYSIINVIAYGSLLYAYIQLLKVILMDASYKPIIWAVASSLIFDFIAKLLWNTKLKDKEDAFKKAWLFLKYWGTRILAFIFYICAYHSLFLGIWIAGKYTVGKGQTPLYYSILYLGGFIFFMLISMDLRMDSYKHKHDMLKLKFRTYWGDNKDSLLKFIGNKAAVLGLALLFICLFHFAWSVYQANYLGNSYMPNAWLLFGSLSGTVCLGVIWEHLRDKRKALGKENLKVAKET